uniref:Col_cuticle_N domain-containing protein n=1 Tax=Steinernema glaseri TaxID=37863 RepID=A0A1I7ZEN4_9BILA
MFTRAWQLFPEPWRGGTMGVSGRESVATRSSSWDRVSPQEVPVGMYVFRRPVTSEGRFLIYLPNGGYADGHVEAVFVVIIVLAAAFLASALLVCLQLTIRHAVSKANRVLEESPDRQLLIANYQDYEAAEFV